MMMRQHCLLGERGGGRRKWEGEVGGGGKRSGEEEGEEEIVPALALGPYLVLTTTSQQLPLRPGHALAS